MLQSFKSSLYRNLSKASEHTYLLAVSGGLDSMVMLSLFMSSNLRVVVAHVDHQTRNGESSSDAAFVKNYCEKREIVFHSTLFDKTESGENNFQAAARAFRYRYFEHLCDTFTYDYICTAHHKNDKLETLLMNLGRASGLGGLSVMPYLSDDRKLRPLLPFSRADLEQYASDHNVPFVHDRSNDSDDYDRNRIRHHVIPELVRIFPHYVEGANRASDYLRAEQELLSFYIEEELLIKSEGITSIVDLRRIRSTPQEATLLHRLLSPMGFSFSDCFDILGCQQVGSRFQTATFEAIYQGQTLIFRPLATGLEPYEVKVDGLGTWIDGRVEVCVTEGHSSIEGKQLLATLKVEPSQILAGIYIRSPKAGDRIRPWHMHGKSKMLKKLMVDEKLSRFEKEQVIVITDLKGKLLHVKTKRLLHQHTKEDSSLSHWFINVYVSK